MLTGVILAGGKNRSKGAAKSLLSLKDEKLVERQVREMKQLCSEVIVVTNEPRLLLPVLGSTVRIITDFFPGKGPLAGMHAAFSLAAHSQLWVVGCDMPFISAEAAEFMRRRKRMAEAEAVIPRIQGKLYPLHGIYDKRCRDSAAVLLQKGEKRMSELFNLIRWEEVPESLMIELGIHTDFVRTVENQADYEKAIQEMSQQVG